MLIIKVILLVVAMLVTLVVSFLLDDFIIHTSLVDETISKKRIKFIRVTIHIISIFLMMTLGIFFLALLIKFN